MSDNLTTIVNLDLAVALDLSAPAKSSVRHGLVRPADLRSRVSQADIREADAHYRAKVISRCDQAYAAAWQRFESGAIDVDEYRRLCRAAKAEFDRKIV